MKKPVMDLGDQEQLVHLATLIIERKFHGDPNMTVERLVQVIQTKVKEVLKIA